MMSNNDELIAVPLAHIFPAIAELSRCVVDIYLVTAATRVICRLITRLVTRPSYGQFTRLAKFCRYLSLP